MNHLSNDVVFIVFCLLRPSTSCYFCSTREVMVRYENQCSLDAKAVTADISSLTGQVVKLYFSSMTTLPKSMLFRSVILIQIFGNHMLQFQVRHSTIPFHQIFHIMLLI